LSFKTGSKPEWQAMNKASTVSSIPLYQVRMPSAVANLAAEVLNSGQIAVGPNVEKFEGCSAITWGILG